MRARPTSSASVTDDVEDQIQIHFLAAGGGALGPGR
jgi:hypothetical protein